MKKPVVIEVLSHRRAKVVDPSEALTEVLDRELSFQATEERFARMHNGAWDGRKRFYHAMSGSFALGLLRRVKTLIEDLGLRVKVRDLRTEKPPQPDMSLVHPDMLEGVSMSGMYALQFKALTRLLKRGGGVLRAATNTGKSTVAASLVKAYLPNIRGGVILVHKQKLLQDHRRDLAKFLGTIEQNIGQIGSGIWEPKKITIALVDSLLLRANAKRNHKRIRDFLRIQDLLILDECFPAGTQIGNIPIEKIRVGDLVPSFDETTQTFYQKKVVRTFRSLPKEMCCIHVGDVIVNCTTGHPFYTRKGWKSAGSLTKEDLVLHGSYRSENVCDLPQHSDSSRTQGFRESPVRSELLRWRLQDRVPTQTQFCANDKDKSEVRLGENASQQSNAKARCASEDARHSHKNWAQAEDSGGKREGFDNTSSTSFSISEEESSREVGDGVRGSDEGSQPSASLQDRHSSTSEENCDRDRRVFSLLARSPSAGPKEDQTFAWSRVDRVEILQSGRDGKFSSVCSDGFVYNLEVADTHTYVANGFVVHNCHHGGAKKWARVLQRCNAPVRIGLSGSYVPGGASLGIEAQLGPVVFKVTNAQLTSLGISAKLTVKLREIEEPEDLEGAWRDVYQQGIVDNVQRNAQIAEDTLDAFSKKLPVVVMVREKRHGRNLSELLRARKVPHKFLYSTGFPGGLKAIEGFLAAFEKGILPVLLTTTGLFDEGANLPAIRRLIMGDGLKSLRLVLQKCGRALRRKKGEDNTVEVYDYMDVFNEWLAGHSLERLNIYEKEGFEVIEL